MKKDEEQTNNSLLDIASTTNTIVNKVGKGMEKKKEHSDLQMELKMGIIFLSNTIKMDGKGVVEVDIKHIVWPK